MTDVRSKVLVAAALVVLGAGCGNQNNLDAPLPPGHGRLVVELVDAPPKNLKEIVVTIDKVTAHSNAAGWVQVASNVGKVDILKLKTYAMQLGFATMPAGKVTQMRLYLKEGSEQYVTLADGKRADLKVPSGTQSGIKIQGGFDLAECANTTLTLDFDGVQSVCGESSGKKETFVLRPVIRVKKTSSITGLCRTVDGGTTPGQPEGGGKGNGGGTECGGSQCKNSSDCLSGSCKHGKCVPGTPGSACQVNSDCASGTCLPSGNCSAGPAKGTGSACANDNECLSGGCTNGFCEAGGQGSPCKVEADCAQDYKCDTTKNPGVCVAIEIG